MYRSLSDRGSFTEYVYVSLVPFANLSRSQANLPASRAAFFLLSSHRSSDLPQISSKVPIPAGLRREVNVSAPIHFASLTQSEGCRTSYGPTVFKPADAIQVACVPDGSASSLVQEKLENTKGKADLAENELV
jgi:hypothetical protein